MRGAVVGKKAIWQGATKENALYGSSTEEQRRQTAFFPKTLRAAGLLPVASVGSVGAARYGDAPASPPWPQPKSLAAAPLMVFKQALKECCGRLVGASRRDARTLGEASLPMNLVPPFSVLRIKFCKSPFSLRSPVASLPPRQPR